MNLKSTQNEQAIACHGVKLKNPNVIDQSIEFVKLDIRDLSRRRKNLRSEDVAKV